MHYCHPHHFLEIFETQVNEPIGSYQMQHLNTQSIKNLRQTFFQHWARECKSEVKVEKHPLVVEVKLKMVPDTILTFSIPALPQHVSFQMSAYLSQLCIWNLCQKSSPQIFYKWYINGDME